MQHISRVLSLPVTVLELHQFLHSRFFPLFSTYFPRSIAVASNTHTRLFLCFHNRHTFSLSLLLDSKRAPSSSVFCCLYSFSVTFQSQQHWHSFLSPSPMPPTCLVRISKPAPTLKEKSPPCLFIFLHLTWILIRFVVLYLHLCHLLLFFSTPSIASISAN